MQKEECCGPLFLYSCSYLVSAKQLVWLSIRISEEDILVMRVTKQGGGGPEEVGPGRARRGCECRREKQENEEGR